MCVEIGNSPLKQVKVCGVSITCDGTWCIFLYSQLSCLETKNDDTDRI